MLTCREVTQLVGSDNVRVAPLRTRLAVRLHLVMCRHCRRYRRELQVIGAAARRHVSTLFGAESADDERVLRVQSAALREIRGTPTDD